MTDKPTGTWHFAALETRARARPPIIAAGPRRPSAEGLHPYARRVIDAELGRLDTCRITPLGQPPAWDSTTFEVACNLIEIANSPWSGYTLAQARADLDTRAPRDRGFTDKRIDAKWRSAEKKIGGAGRPEPPDHAGRGDRAQRWQADPGRARGRHPDMRRLPLIMGEPVARRHVRALRQAGSAQPAAPVPEQAADAEEDGGAAFDMDVAREAHTLRVRQAAREQVAAEKAGDQPGFDAGTLAEVLDRPPEPSHRVEDLIPANSSTLVVAQRKTGKTTLTLNLARMPDRRWSLPRPVPHRARQRQRRDPQL